MAPQGGYTPPPPPPPPLPPIIALSSRLKLVAEELVVTDILEAEGSTHSGKFDIRGNALIGVDIGSAKYDKIDKEKRTATIELPQPGVIQAKVDHEQTKEWDISRTTWIPFIGDENLIRKEAMRQAQRLVEAAANSNKDAFANARRRTSDTVRKFFAEIGWDVTVTWVDSG